MARNGRLAEDGIALVTVEDNDQLIATAAAAFQAWKAAAVAAGTSIHIVEPAGAYRSAWVQNDMVDNPGRYNLNPNSKIRFGRSGQSHGWGNRVDIGGDLGWAIRTGHLFGWTREYGAKDPNHFVHDGRTAISGAGQGGGGTTERRRRMSVKWMRSKATGDFFLDDGKSWREFCPLTNADGSVHRLHDGSEGRERVPFRYLQNISEAYGFSANPVDSDTILQAKATAG